MKRACLSSFRTLTLFLATVATLCCTASSLQAADGDGDGMDDAWELQFWGNTASTATADADQDGVSNLFEYQSNLNPLAADSNGDGKNDAVGIPGFLSAERWDDVPGDDTLASAFCSEAFLKGTPVTSLVNQTEAAQNTGNDFVVRWLGTLTAPVTGSYRFYLASDNQSQLWLGEAGGSKFTRRKIAWVNDWTGYRAWTVNAFFFKTAASFPWSPGRNITSRW